MGAEGTSIKVTPRPWFGGFGPGVALALLAGPTRPKIDLFFEKSWGPKQNPKAFGRRALGVVGAAPGPPEMSESHAPPLVWRGEAPLCGCYARFGGVLKIANF